MSVGDQLQLEESSDLLDQARCKWSTWMTDDPRLAVVDSFDDLRSWLPTVTREEADEVLLVLAMLAAPDGGDDIAAAAALAKCMLPGVCRLAGWLSSLPPREVFHDNQPNRAGAWWAVERIDELVAAQLWIEVRSFPWRRLTKVASNIIVNTKVGVLREVGAHAYLTRADRAWAQTDLVDFAVGSPPSGGGDGPSEWVSNTLSPTCSATLQVQRVRLTPQAPDMEPADELLELLAWACERDVISDSDRQLLLCLVSEADSVRTRNIGRGYGGLIGNELSIKVAPRFGISEATVRRKASRSVRALAQVAGSYARDN